MQLESIEGLEDGEAEGEETRDWTRLVSVLHALIAQGGGKDGEQQYASLRDPSRSCSVGGRGRL